jgi:hypothetical protein
VSFIMGLGRAGRPRAARHDAWDSVRQDEEFHTGAPNQFRGLQALLSDPHSRVFVAEVEGRVV